MKRSGIAASLVVLEGLVALGAIVGALGLLWNGLGMGPEVLAATPFSAWWQAGAALFLINAVLPLMVAAGTVRRAPWATFAHLAYGAVLIGWIGFQIGFIGLISVLQPVFGAVGLSIVLLAALDLVPTHRTAE